MRLLTLITNQSSTWRNLQFRVRTQCPFTGRCHRIPNNQPYLTGGRPLAITRLPLSSERVPCCTFHKLSPPKRHTANISKHLVTYQRKKGNQQSIKAPIIIPSVLAALCSALQLLCCCLIVVPAKKNQSITLCQSSILSYITLIEI